MMITAYRAEDRTYSTTAFSQFKRSFIWHCPLL